MLNHFNALTALRTRLLTAQFAGTGVTALASTGNGFTRTAGDFITDGFKVGMEVTPSGFTDESLGIITSVSATEILLRDGRGFEPEANGRSLSVVIPSIRSWINKEALEDDTGWILIEDYIPNIPVRITSGPLGEIETRPMYHLHIKGFKDTGVGAMYAVADGILAHFPPRYALTLADSTVLRVTSDTGPYRTSIWYDDQDRASITVTIPLWARTQNLI